MKRVMRRNVGMASLAAAACVLLSTSGAAGAEAQAAFTPERSPAPGSRTYANASLVAMRSWRSGPPCRLATGLPR